MQNTNMTSGFDALGVNARMCEQLQKLSIHTPTPIQAGAIPHALDGKDIIGVAQTGTGKTLAFALPMLARLSSEQVGLVLAPTRELAQQISETYRKLGITTVLVIGGAGMHLQVNQLRRRHAVIVATPGRLQDHLNQGTFRLNRISIVVLDEADRMLDMGFAPAIKEILNQVPRAHQTLLFSATMPKEIEELANSYLRHPERIEVAKSGTASELVEQELLVVPHEEKLEMLKMLLNKNEGSVLVFARTRHGARKLAKNVQIAGHTSGELHSDRTLAQRRAALGGFKSGEHRVLVATDIAARGIDVTGISLVVNYDIPEHADDYIHRIGRTGRAGATGRAVTFATPGQQKEIRAIEKLLGTRLALADKSLQKPNDERERPASRERTRRANPRNRSRAIDQERTLKTSVEPAKELVAPAPASKQRNRTKRNPVGAAKAVTHTPPKRTHRGWSGKPKRRSSI